MNRSAARWELVERLYHETLARDPDARRGFLRDACGGDDELRQEVESLLAYESRLPAFLAGDPLQLVGHSPYPDPDGPLTGRQLGPFIIGSLIAAGGMGEVYRGRDTKLDRDVAIKILPSAVADDPNRRSRFEREARLLASLNHPHIETIFGFEDHDGVRALILELIEGGTLSQRIARGPLPVAEALAVARQIADALAAAHAKGIVHRDLKPENVALHTVDGASPTVKVLDFGLAKSFAAAPPIDNTTTPGMLLGTCSYMSPEQARGGDVDARSDVWSFGCVLYEMLSGRKAFAGATVSDTLAAILDRDPDWDALPAATPKSIALLVRRCLVKDVNQRLQTMTAVRAEIDRVVVDHGVWRRTWQTVGVAALVAALAIAAVAVFRVLPARENDVATRLSVSVPGIISPQLSATLSPDGRQLAFVSTGSTGKLMLFVRTLDSLEARALPGSENAAHPFWSPDGRSLGFLADGKLKKTAAAGGRVDILADAPERAGSTWNLQGTILFPSRLGALGTISSDGGPVTPLIDRDDRGHAVRWPTFLPDGRHFLFWRSSPRGDERGIYVGSLDSHDIKLLVQSEYKGGYAAGHLLFVRDDALLAQPLDTAKWELTGKPVRIADGVWTAAGAGQASFSASANAVAYVNASLANTQLALFDRAGKLRGMVAAPNRYSGTPQFSPDGARIAAAQGAPGGEHVWLLGADGQSSSRLTFGQARESAPIWSADGSRLAFLSTTAGKASLVVKSVESRAEETVFESDRIVSLDDWSRDGRFLVYSTTSANAYSDLWLLQLAAERRPLPFLQSRFNKTQAQVSPDGHWIAYTSYESGADEVYVESFPKPGNKRQISSGGGVQPRWRRDGAELFYIALDQRLMAVPIRSGPLLESGPPAALFKTRVLPHGSQSIGLHTLYDVSPDGQHFVCVVPPEDPGPPVTVVLNWTAVLAPINSR